MKVLLHYVDDQTDYHASLEMALAMTGNKHELKSWLGGDAVERFMREEIQPTTTVRYLIDINMPVPNSIKKLPIWPKNGVDPHSCGIALAKWLVENKKCDISHIAFTTHWGQENYRIQEELEELNIGPYKGKMFKKNLEGIQELLNWLGS